MKGPTMPSFCRRVRPDFLHDLIEQRIYLPKAISEATALAIADRGWKSSDEDIKKLIKYMAFYTSYVKIGGSSQSPAPASQSSAPASASELA